MDRRALFMFHILVRFFILSFCTCMVSGIPFIQDGMPNKQLMKDCPEAMFYKQLQQNDCPDNEEQFHCLPFYISTSAFTGFITLCKPAVWFVKGTYPVYYNGIITAFKCPSNRYQEEPYRSHKPNMFMCPKEKTNCPEEGQYTLRLNSTISNDLCYCVEEYTLLVPSDNGTFCKPETEDCTCKRIVTTKTHVTDPVDAPKTTKRPKHEREKDTETKTASAKKGKSNAFYAGIAVLCLILLNIICVILGCFLKKVVGKNWLECRRKCNSEEISVQKTEDSSIKSTVEEQNGNECTAMIDTTANILDHTSNLLVTQPTQESNGIQNNPEYDIQACDDIPKNQSGTKLRILKIEDPVLV